jgi:hypothetical protein
MAKTNTQRSEQSGGYISIDPREAIKRNESVITQIRDLVRRSQSERVRELAVKHEK